MYCPLGVLKPANPPLHPASVIAATEMTAIASIAAASRGNGRLMKLKPSTSAPIPAIGHTGIPGRMGELAFRAVAAGVPASCIVMTVVSPSAPGVTVGGLNVAVAPGGRPLAASVTTLLNAPPSGGTVTVICTEPPSATSNGVCGAATV